MCRLMFLVERGRVVFEISYEVASIDHWLYFDIGFLVRFRQSMITTCGIVGEIASRISKAKQLRESTTPVTSP